MESITGEGHIGADLLTLVLEASGHLSGKVLGPLAATGQPRAAVRHARRDHGDGI